MSKFLLKTFESFKELRKINEASGNTYSYGCAMIYFNMPEMDDLHAKIEERDIYMEDGDNSYGLENEPHVTLLYGIHSDEVSDDEVMKLLNSFKSTLNTIKLTKVSKFENSKFEVLKFDAEGDVLHEINSTLCKELPFTTDYPDYHPHMTIAYLKPKMAQKYIDILEGMNFELEPVKFVYSKPDGTKITESI